MVLVNDTYCGLIEFESEFDRVKFRRYWKTRRKLKGGKF
jgi:hypothetical protein